MIFSHIRTQAPDITCGSSRGMGHLGGAGPPEDGATVAVRHDEQEGEAGNRAVAAGERALWVSMLAAPTWGPGLRPRSR